MARPVCLRPSGCNWPKTCPSTVKHLPCAGWRFRNRARTRRDRSRIPIIADRAKQSLVKLALEPEWETKFEANSYGFRPGRSAWDAIGAIYVQINQKPKWALDADIAKCFDRIDHTTLLRKIDANPTVTRQIKAWLKAGVMNNGELFPTEAGTPQGGTVSPLLANIALHGLEEMIHRAYPGRKAPAVIRYADDLVVLHPDRQVIEQCQELIAAERKEGGG